MLSDKVVLVEDAHKVYGLLHRLHVELKSMDAHPRAKGYGRRFGYKSGDPSIAHAARSPPKLIISDLRNFQFLEQDAQIEFEVLVMNYATHQKGSAFAVGQVVHAKGAWDTDASCCFSRSRPKISRLLAK